MCKKQTIVSQSTVFHRSIGSHQTASYKGHKLTTVKEIKLRYNLYEKNRETDQPHQQTTTTEQQIPN